MMVWTGLIFVSDMEDGVLGGFDVACRSGCLIVRVFGHPTGKAMWDWILFSKQASNQPTREDQEASNQVSQDE